MRYNNDGSLDTTFGSGGKVSGGFGGNDSFRAVALQPDGKIVAAGGNGFEFLVARFNSNGSLDSSFGSGGLVITDKLYGGFGFVDSRTIAIQQNGKIVVSGSTRAPFFIHALLRLNSNGSLDSSFGSDRRVITDFGIDCCRGGFVAVALQGDGKIVAGGTTGAGFALARYDGDVTNFDICVQDDSSGSILQINTTTGAYQFTNCSGFTISGTGSLTRRGSSITLQHTASDRRVMAKVDVGINKATASIQMLSQGLSFTITDRNTINNTCSCR